MKRRLILSFAVLAVAVFLFLCVGYLRQYNMEAIEPQQAVQIARDKANVLGFSLDGYSENTAVWFKSIVVTFEPPEFSFGGVLKITIDRKSGKVTEIYREQ